jgi:hypothetical protein
MLNFEASLKTPMLESFPFLTTANPISRKHKAGALTQALATTIHGVHLATMSIVIQHHQLVDHPFLLAIVLLINT